MRCKKSWRNKGTEEGKPGRTAGLAPGWACRPERYRVERTPAGKEGWGGSECLVTSYNPRRPGCLHSFHRQGTGGILPRGSGLLRVEGRCRVGTQALEQTQRFRPYSVNVISLLSSCRPRW